MLAGRLPAASVAVDATAMMQAGIGAGYAERIIRAEIAEFVERGSSCGRRRSAWRSASPSSECHDVMVHQRHGHRRQRHHARHHSRRAAVVREREHGTMEHLLAMLVTPLEIVMSKVLANGLVVTVARVVVPVVRRLRVPVAGSVPLFMVGVVPLPVLRPGWHLPGDDRTHHAASGCSSSWYGSVNLLSGNTPLESMPTCAFWMACRPRRTSCPFAQAILIVGGLPTRSGRNISPLPAWVSRYRREPAALPQLSPSRVRSAMLTAGGEKPRQTTVSSALSCRCRHRPQRARSSASAAPPQGNAVDDHGDRRRHRILC